MSTGPAWPGAGGPVIDTKNFKKGQLFYQLSSQFAFGCYNWEKIAATSKVQVAANMKLPFHGVQVCGDILFAARGGNIHSFKLTDGSHISCWKYPVEGQDRNSKLVIDVSENSTPAPSQDEHVPPAKRVKLGNGDATTGEVELDAEADVKPVVEESERNDTPTKGKKTKNPLDRPGPPSQLLERPMVNIMTATKEGSHLIAVTSDKSIWVFEHDGQGQLRQLSRRYVDSECHQLLAMTRHPS